MARRLGKTAVVANHHKRRRSGPFGLCVGTQNAIEFLVVQSQRFFDEHALAGA